MYRQQPEYESRLIESGFREEMPFFREAITLIDQCTKLVKDDRILLRNKIKEYSKDLRQNRVIQKNWEHQQMQTLIQIFVEGNKKKSLNKIHKGDRVMDWLQIKLRKFLDNSKKQKHKKEVQNFRSGKFINIKKSIYKPNNSIFKENNNNSQRNKDHSVQAICNMPASRKFTTLNAYSLSRSREKATSESRKIKQNQSYSQYSYHKHFSFLRKNQRNYSNQNQLKNKHKQSIDQNKKKQEIISVSSNINKQIPLKGQKIDGFLKISNLPQKTNNYKLPKSQILKKQNKIQTKESSQLNKLTKLFTQQLNNQANKKTETTSEIQPKKQYLVNDSLQWSKNYLVSQPPVSDRQTNYLNNSIRRYQQSTKKIQQMVQKSKNIFSEYEFQKNDQVIFPQNLPTISLPIYEKDTLPKYDKINEELFTPPQFLEECKKFLSSNKKHVVEIQQNLYVDQEKDSNKKLTFTNILSDSKQRQKLQQKYSIPSILNQFGINQVISENASLNISTKKPSGQVNRLFKNISIHTIEDLLLQIFKVSHHRLLDRYQLGEIMSKSNQECEKDLQKFCELLDKQSQKSNEKYYFDFITILKYFHSHKKVFKQSQEHFSNFLSEILDIKKKEFINQQDIHSFLSVLEQSQIQPKALSSIKINLQEIMRKCLQIESSSVFTRFGLFYLQLKRDQNFQFIRESLANFDFQFGSETDSLQQ